VTPFSTNNQQTNDNQTTNQPSKLSKEINSCKVLCQNIPINGLVISGIDVISVCGVIVVTV
jgi:hypothetical protein